MTIPSERNGVTRIGKDYRHDMAEVPCLIPRRGHATGIAGEYT